MMPQKVLLLTKELSFVVPGKKVRVFAGPNGSGKSSLFEEFSSEYNTGFFVNADELEKKLAKSATINLSEIGLAATQEQLDRFKLLPASVSLFEKAEKEGHEINVSIENNSIIDAALDTHSYEGSFVAAFIRDLLIAQNKSFSFETVMSHPSKIDEIKALITDGYRVYLYFVCIDDPSVNISRVHDRVIKGGHGVSADKIEERYYRTLELLHQMLRLSYRAYLFDNSGKSMKLIAEQYNGDLQIKISPQPFWFQKYVLPYYEL